MYINNFSQLKRWMIFDTGTYYKFVALVRAKDFPNWKVPLLSGHDRNEHFIRQWFVGSEAELEMYKEEMKGICKATYSRLYVTTDRKSVKKTILKMQDQLSEYIKQMLFDPNAAISLRKLSKFSSSASQMKDCSAGSKYWLIDIDLNSVPSADKSDYLHKLLEAFSAIIAPYTPVVHMTPNGAHILVERSFDLHGAITLFLAQNNSPSFELQLGNKVVKAGNVLKQQCDILTERECWEIKENALTLVFMDI